MGRKNKYSKELKLSIVKRYLEGEGSTISLAKEINTAANIVSSWVKKYNAFGESAFDISHTNASYTKNFKKQVVLDYLNGGGSYDDLAIKYHIPSSSPIKNWVKLYNSHIELKDYIPGGEDIYMAKSRKESQAFRRCLRTGSLRKNCPITRAIIMMISVRTELISTFATCTFG